MKRIIQKELCYGCGSCAQKCTSGAIIMTKDAQGFLYPIINEKKCTNCGLCIKSCPAINRKTQKKEPINEAYAVKSIYSQDCASGGAFYNIAKEWINNGGYVAGSIWNEEFIPEIILTNDINKLKKMQGSKYVQGTTNNSYEQTLKLLNQNIKVLYSGTPCQIAGLYSFLNKDYTNLYTIEILCHAGGSPKFWQKYVEFVNKKYNKTLIDCKIQNSKDKMILSFNDNTTVIENLNLENEYISFFLTGKTKRDACNTCPFMGRIRNADIIIGDIWAKWAAKKRKDGISLVILNSNKAQKLFENIKWEYINNFDINSKLNEPLNKINNNLPIPDPDRKDIFNKISSNLSFSEIIKNKKIALMNYNYPRDNYGALLLAFALENVLKNMGYEPYTINYYKNPFCIDFDPQGATWKFREKFLHLYGFYNDNERLHLLNDNFETFIFGSDIIWAQTREYVYYGDWVNSSKRLISYAASFCENKLPPKDEYKKKCIQRFDKVSVREKSGINICKNYANIDATHVIDPTLLLTKEDYQEIIDSEYSDIPEKDYIAYYTFTDLNPNDIQFNIPIYNLFKDNFNFTRTFGQWLNMIKNAKCIITGSFHGVCFSLLYNRPFIYVKKPNEDNERVISLFEILGIPKEHIVDSVNEISEELINKNINWDLINSKIKEFREFSINWLKESIECPIKEKINIKKNIDNKTHFQINLLGIKIKIRKRKKQI